MPDYDIPVPRSAPVRARYLDLDGKERIVNATGPLAVCFQHEIDHTNGVLFTDRVSRLRRERAKTYFAKVRRRANFGCWIADGPGGGSISKITLRRFERFQLGV